MIDYRRSKIRRLFFSTPKSVLKLFLFPKRFIDPSKSYYPECNHKSFLSVFWDQLRFALRFGYNNDEYYLYGLDVKDANYRQKDYIPEYYNIDSLLYQNRNYVLKESKQFGYFNYLCLLRDKWVFSKIMEGAGFPIPNTVGLLIHGSFIANSSHVISGIAGLLDNDRNVMLKPISGNSGKGILHLIVRDSHFIYKNKELLEDEVTEMVKDGIYIVQEYIINQHPLLSSLFSGSVNTLRITLARKEDSIELMGVMCLMGARDAEFSNWHYGGVCVNVKSDGTLDKYGFSFSDKRITSHPDSGIVFEGFKIPFYDESIALAKQAMNVFYGFKTIGWDIAITDEGPIFIEGNDGWGIAAHQMVENSGWANKYSYIFGD